MRNARPILALNDVRNRPGIVLRPALPYSPAGGRVNARRLKYGLPSIGRPLASALPLPNAAVPPVLARLPDTRAVSGVPLVALKLPLSCQTSSSLRVIPLPRRKPRAPPTGEVAV